MTSYSLSAQTSAKLELLFSTMGFRPGTNGETTVNAYLLALRDYQPDDVTATVDLVLRGKVKWLSKKWVPTPAEFCDAIEQYVASTKRPEPDAPVTPQYRLSQPKSKVIERDVTKDRAKQMADNGAAPRGSIWIPGSLAENPAFGTLYEPDPKWFFEHKNIRDEHKKDPETDTPESRIRMLFKMSMLSKANHLGPSAVDKIAEAQKTGRMDEFIALAQSWGMDVPEAVWAQKDHVWVRNSY